MKPRKWIAENTALLSALMIVVGILLMVLADKVPHPASRKLLASFGVLFASIFFVSFLYEKFLAEKHFAQFRDSMHEELLRLDSVQSLCARLGIREIFETRNGLEQAHPFVDLLNGAEPGGRVLVVARTMLHIVAQEEAFKSVLRKGGRLDLVCANPQSMDRTLATISHLRNSDIRPILESFRDLRNWAKDEQPAGTLDLRASAQPLPDSFLLAELEDRDIAVWDLTFGRDLIHKRVFVLELTKGGLGRDLLKRYETVFAEASPVLAIETGGQVITDDVDESIEAWF